MVAEILHSNFHVTKADRERSCVTAYLTAVGFILAISFVLYWVEYVRQESKADIASECIDCSEYENASMEMNSPCEVYTRLALLC